MVGEEGEELGTEAQNGEQISSQLSYSLVQGQNKSPNSLAWRLVSYHCCLKPGSIFFFFLIPLTHLHASSIATPSREFELEFVFLSKQFRDFSIHSGSHQERSGGMTFFIVSLV